MTPTDQGIRAMHHYAGRLWDAWRDLVAAYAADTGDTTQPHLAALPWANLSEVTQHAFIAQLGSFRNGGTGTNAALYAAVEKARKTPLPP